MGYDRKYGRVTTEFGTIGENEPVVVFRAQDKLLAPLLKIYKVLCAIAGSPQHHLDIIHDTAMVVKRYQHDNPPRVPNSNNFVQRIGGEYHQQYPSGVNRTVNDEYSEGN